MRDVDRARECARARTPPGERASITTTFSPAGEATAEIPRVDLVGQLRSRSARAARSRRSSYGVRSRRARRPRARPRCACARARRPRAPRRRAGSRPRRPGEREAQAARGSAVVAELEARREEHARAHRVGEQRRRCRTTPGSSTQSWRPPSGSVQRDAVGHLGGERLEQRVAARRAARGAAARGGGRSRRCRRTSASAACSICEPAEVGRVLQRQQRVDGAPARRDRADARAREQRLREREELHHEARARRGPRAAPRACPRSAGPSRRRLRSPACPPRAAIASSARRCSSDVRRAERVVEGGHRVERLHLGRVRARVRARRDRARRRASAPARRAGRAQTSDREHVVVGGLLDGDRVARDRRRGAARGTMPSLAPCVSMSRVGAHVHAGGAQPLGEHLAQAGVALGPAVAEAARCRRRASTRFSARRNSSTG